MPPRAPPQRPVQRAGARGRYRGRPANGHGVSQGGPVAAAAVVQGADDAGIPAGFGLAVISGLADDVRVWSTSSGVSVQMSWPSAAATA